MAADELVSPLLGEARECGPATVPRGLTSAEAAAKLAEFGRNEVRFHWSPTGGPRCPCCRDSRVSHLYFSM